MDKYKNQAFEAEVLFNQGSKFQIKSVTAIILDIGKDSKGKTQFVSRAIDLIKQPEFISILKPGAKIEILMREV